MRNWAGNVISTIKSFIAIGLVNNDHIKVLCGFLDNNVMNETASVMTVRVKSFSSWNWHTEGFKVEQKRKLNGKYCVHAHRGLIDTKFLQYLGVTWMVKLQSSNILFI